VPIDHHDNITNKSGDNGKQTPDNFRYDFFDMKFRRQIAQAL